MSAELPSVRAYIVRERRREYLSEIKEIRVVSHAPLSLMSSELVLYTEPSEAFSLGLQTPKFSESCKFYPAHARSS